MNERREEADAARVKPPTAKELREAIAGVRSALERHRESLKKGGATTDERVSVAFESLGRIGFWIDWLDGKEGPR